MMWPVGFEPTKTVSYTHRPFPFPDYGSGGSSANLLTATRYINICSFIKQHQKFICDFFEDLKLHNESHPPVSSVAYQEAWHSLYLFFPILF